MGTVPEGPGLLGLQAPTLWGPSLFCMATWTLDILSGGVHALESKLLANLKGHGHSLGVLNRVTV